MTYEQKYDILEDMYVLRKIVDKINFLREHIKDVYGENITVKELEELLWDQYNNINKRIDDKLGIEK